ncbi:MAG TPA: ribulose-phosphate 3-epimerase [Ignavibacteriaceae bacterium]
MALLAPSVLSADFSNLSQQIRLTELGGADWIHCDIMDGHFVPNITFGPVVVRSIKKSTKLPVDVHLMIEKPDKYLKNFSEAGADYISVHVEEVVHLNRTINRIKELGCKAGVVINPATPVEAIKDVAEYIDLLLIMTVNPGFAGQKFIPNSIRRIKEAVSLKKQLNANYLIEIDGGVNAETIRQAYEAGVNVFVAGSSIFEAENITAATAQLKNLIK